MALKLVLTKKAFEALDEKYRDLYKLDGDVYKLDAEVEDSETTQALAKIKANNEKLTEELKELKAAKKKEATEAEERQQNELRSKGRVEELEASYKKKLADAEAAQASERDAFRARIAKQMLDAETARLTGDLFVSGKLGDPHVRGRLAVEWDTNGEPAIRVMGPDGKASASTLDDLRKELSTDKELSAILKGSKAAGGGRDGASGKDPSTSDDKQPKPSLWDKNTDADAALERIRSRQQPDAAVE